MLPNFFVIGAAKCGTTSLAFYLQAHPEIHLSPVKETRYFAAPDPHKPFGGPRIGRRREYEALFESSAPARGEASPAYSQHPWRAGVPERIHALIPGARLVYLVGDPIKRLVSHYRQALAHTGETQTLAQILEQPDHPFLCAGRYALQLERYLEVFPREQLLVIDQDQLLHERRRALERVFDFLHVSPDFWSAEFELMRNRGSEHRVLSRGPYARLRASALHGALGALPDRLRRGLVSSARRALAPAVGELALDSSQREHLEACYRPEAARLREITGQSFSGWSL